jgi:hypothetical protein
MLSHCANLQCSKPFLRLREGRLFLVEAASIAKPEGVSRRASLLLRKPLLRKPPRHLERYWLCDQCASVWTLIQDRKEGVVLMPLTRAATGASAAASSGVT